MYSSINPLEPRADRRALAAAQGRSGSHQSFRDMRLHPQPAPAYAYPGHSVSLSCPWRWHTTARHWRKSTASRRMSVPCAARAAAGCVWPRPSPRDKPRILFNYLSEPDDWTEMRACVRLTREIFAQPAFDPYRGREIQPGSDVQSDAEIDAFIRAKVESAYHPSCSCKMGRRTRIRWRWSIRTPGFMDGRPARGGFLHHAVDNHGKSQRSHHHAGRESRGPHPGKRPAAGPEDAPFYAGAELAELAALIAGYGSVLRAKP